jgi:hypothetical protein
LADIIDENNFTLLRWGIKKTTNQSLNPIPGVFTPGIFLIYFILLVFKSAVTALNEVLLFLSTGVFLSVETILRAFL